MSGRSRARHIDGEGGRYDRWLRELQDRIDALSTGKLSSVPGSVITIDQVLTGPNSIYRDEDGDFTLALVDDATVTLNLSHVPIDESLKVWQNGVRLVPETFTRSGSVVTIPPSATVVIREDDNFSSHYRWDTTARVDVPDESLYDAAVLAEPTLLAYYRLAETSGLVMEDSSGNARHGTYTTDVVLGEPAILTSDPDTAGGFHGPDARGVVPSAAWMNVPTLTVEAWLDIDAISSGIQYIVNRDTQGRAWELNAESGGNLRFSKIQSGTVSSTGTATLDDTNRHYVVATYDGANIKLYVDSVLIQTTAATGDPSTTADLAIGATYAGDATWWEPYYFKGTLSKVAFYSGAQSAAAILNRWNIGSTGSP